jgi:UDP-N-acetylglucosamine--N-acetylmuramyl-(pentapeptide) pyrophosphoryl-undecaprenol N-acetylglucosamine transferase
MRVLVAGGGSGGHIYPILAVTEELEKKGVKDIVYVGSGLGMESKIIPQLGMVFVPIHAGKFRRYHNNLILNIIDPTTFFKNAFDFFNFVRGYFESLFIIKKYSPDVVFIKGGFVGVPIGLAAASLGKKIIIHESDSKMGMANKLLSRFAEIIMVSYPEKYFKELGEERLIFTGNPVRKELLEGEKNKALKIFELNESLPVILVMGGSQGSRFINNLVLDSTNQLLDKYQIIHVTGDLDYADIVSRRSKFSLKRKDRYRVFNYLSKELKHAYAICDLVISRAGQNSIAEFCALGKPMILIPHGPVTAHQHQNAKIMSRLGAAYMMIEEDINKDIFVDQINLLFEKEGELDFLSKKSKEVGRPQAAKEMAEVIIGENKDESQFEEIIPDQEEK